MEPGHRRQHGTGVRPRAARVGEDANSEVTGRQPPSAMSPERRPLTAGEVLQFQRAVGNRITAVVMRSRERGGVDAPPPAWAALQTEFEALMKALLRLNSEGPAIGERSHLTTRLQEIWSEIGAPGAKSDAELAKVGAELRAFKRGLAEENKLAQDTWSVLDEEYQLERNRLSASKELSDQKALGYLDASYDRAWKRIVAASNYAQWHDISDLGQVMTGERHIQKGFAASITEAARTGPVDKLTAWPWPSFKAAQLAIEGGAAGLHHAEHLKQHIRKALDSAIRYQIRHGVLTMRQLGESQSAAATWAHEVYKKAGPLADEFVDKMPIRSRTAHKWAGRLHVVGKLTVFVDAGVSLIDVWTAPPAERPKKLVVHASRIAGGLAGVAGGARVGAKLGARLGPKGAFVGGLVGGAVGGFVGAWTAKKVAMFVANKIWPPDDTYFEFAGDSARMRSPRSR